MKILIVGGYGFIGGRLAVYFDSLGHDVFICTRKNIDEAPSWCPNAAVVNINWGDLDSIHKACNDIDIVIHAAGVNAIESKQNPEIAMNFNGYSTGQLLNAAILNSISKFLYFSTAHVYSDQLLGDITEESIATNQHPYATSHIMGENLVRKAHQNGDIMGIVIRLSNGYGYPMHKDVNCWMLLVNDLCRQIKKNGSIVINSSGKQLRDFLPLESLNDIVSHLIQLNGIKLGNGLFNVASGHSIRVIDMAERVRHLCQKILNKKIDLEIKGFEPKKCHDFTINIEKLINSGKAVDIDYDKEIINLFKFCISNF